MPYEQKILVTGAFSNIGSFVIREMTSFGYSIITFNQAVLSHVKNEIMYSKQYFPSLGELSTLLGK
jgi:UDP-glucose 4-epimerase